MVVVIAAAGHLLRNGQPLRYAIKVIAFVEDAAGRFGTPRLGSRAMKGRRVPNVLDVDDDFGVTLSQGMEAHGLDSGKLETVKRTADDVPAYLEVAVEASPVLEQMGSPIGVVLALTASTILRVTLKGQTVSWATVPMRDRRDALARSAECVLAAERIGTRTVRRSPSRASTSSLHQHSW